MEYIDIFDEDNEPTGKVKEKNQAHEDGDFHRTAHVWSINNKNELLLQKRSASKKSHPNCWDIFGAGHIRLYIWRHHFYHKLFKLKDNMNTITARRIAEDRTEFMKSFVKEFIDEWNGEK